MTGQSPKNQKKGPYGVFDELTEAALEQAIEKCVPVDDEQIGYIGNEPVFLLCQYMQGVDMPEGTTFNDLRPFVKRWYDLAKDKLIGEDGDCLSFGEVWGQFVEAWEKVKFPKNNALESAKIRATQATYQIPELDWCQDESIIYLARVCYELSQPDGMLFLSGYDAGGILGKTQKPGRLALKMFCAEKIIKCIQVGNRKKASDYQYVGKTLSETKPEKQSAEFEQRKQKMKEDLMRADRKAKASDNR